MEGLYDGGGKGRVAGRVAGWVAGRMAGPGASVQCRPRLRQSSIWVERFRPFHGREPFIGHDAPISLMRFRPMLRP